MNEILTKMKKKGSGRALLAGDCATRATHQPHLEAAQRSDRHLGDHGSDRLFGLPRLSEHGIGLSEPSV